MGTDAFGILKGINANCVLYCHSFMSGMEPNLSHYLLKILKSVLALVGTYVEQVTMSSS